MYIHMMVGHIEMSFVDKTPHGGAIREAPQMEVIIYLSGAREIV